MSKHYNFKEQKGDILDRYNYEGNNIKWEMEGGGRIKLRDMSDNHLRNAFNFLKNNRHRGDYGKGSAWMKILEDEKLLRKRMRKINFNFNVFYVDENKTDLF